MLVLLRLCGPASVLPCLCGPSRWCWNLTRPDLILMQEQPRDSELRFRWRTQIDVGSRPMFTVLPEFNKYPQKPDLPLGLNAVAVFTNTNQEGGGRAWPWS